MLLSKPKVRNVTVRRRNDQMMLQLEISEQNTLGLSPAPEKWSRRRRPRRGKAEGGEFASILIWSSFPHLTNSADELKKDMLPFVLVQHTLYPVLYTCRTAYRNGKGAVILIIVMIVPSMTKPTK